MKVPLSFRTQVKNVHVVRNCPIIGQLNAHYFFFKGEIMGKEEAYEELNEKMEELQTSIDEFSVNLEKACKIHTHISDINDLFCRVFQAPVSYPMILEEEEDK